MSARGIRRDHHGARTFAYHVTSHMETRRMNFDKRSLLYLAGILFVAFCIAAADSFGSGLR